MAQVYSKALDQTIEVGRFIGTIRGAQPGPSVIFLSGMHGNEPSGVFALRQVTAELAGQKTPVRGNIYALAGNLPALEQGTRYTRQDLNRLWYSERMERLHRGELEAADADEAQQVELFACLQKILREDPGPFYFLDLHTTSCETVPFIVLNDSLLNRRFTLQYPLPLILGIEEYLDGPLLSYINELGYVAFGFEAGQHDALSAIRIQEAFIRLSLVFAGCLDPKDGDAASNFSLLVRSSGDTLSFYEIFFRYQIAEGEQFRMEPGFVNFQSIRKGQKLALSNGQDVQASRDAKLFMPLYQSQGEDGFFVIRKVPRFFLNLSETVRKLKADRVLPLLPGVSWANRTRQSLKVDRRVARFFTKQVFHLLGYRSKAIDRDGYIMKNREAGSRTDEYRHTAWWQR